MDKKYIEQRRKVLGEDIAKNKDKFINEIFGSVRNFVEWQNKILAENAELTKIEKDGDKGKDTSPAESKK